VAPCAPRRKVWLAPTGRLPCSNAANRRAQDLRTRSEFCTWQNSVTEQQPPKMYIHRVSKNVPPLACYNFDAREWILIFFGRNVTDKVDNQKTLYYATSNNLCFCTTCQNWETWKSHFSLNWIVLHTMHLCAVFRKEKIVICDVLLTFVEIVTYTINTIHWLLLQAWRRTTLTFCTAADTVTDLANTEHVGNRQQDAMLPS